MTDKALLIIDMQVGNFDDAFPIHQGDKLIANVQHLITQARNSQIPIIYVQHCGGTGEVDEPNTPGWEIHPALAPISTDSVVQKRFPDAFQDTNLQGILQANQIQQVVIAGLQTEYCIDTTCRRAFSLDYSVTLAQDAHSTWSGDALTADQIIAHHNRVLGDWFVRLEKVEEIQF
ncbi:MAG: cysteine hydrolase family protein [Chloroflexota bacterium]